MLEGQFTKLSQLAWAQQKIIQNVQKKRNLGKYIVECHIIILICTIIYGAVLGYFAKGEQVLLNALKIPLLFLVTLYITIPIIFIVDVLLENKISFSQVATLLLLGFTSTSIVLIAFTPLMFFFILTTIDYTFIVLLNISICGFAGYFGIVSILSGFKRFHKDASWSPSLFIGSFIIVFVGTQLAWTLRPFFHSYSEFTRPISGNFYVALGRLIEHNPTIGIVLIGVFLLIALLITVTRLNNDSESVKKQKRLLLKPPVLHTPPPQPPTHAPYIPGQVWGPPIPQPVPTSASAPLLPENKK